MKIAKKAMEEKAQRIADNLLMWAGLKKAKQIASMVKKLLQKETDRRKTIDNKA